MLPNALNGTPITYFGLAFSFGKGPRQGINPNSHIPRPREGIIKTVNLTIRSLLGFEDSVMCMCLVYIIRDRIMRLYSGPLTNSPK